MLTPGEIRRFFREEADIHSAVQYDRILETGIDAHYVGVEQLIGTEYQATEIHKYWKADRFILPKDRVRISAYSRKAFEYPQVLLYAELSLAQIGSEVFYYEFGLQNGIETYNGVLSYQLFTFSTNPAESNLNGIVGAGGFYAMGISLNRYRPENFHTTQHNYKILHMRNMSVFTIDHKPVLFVIPSNTYVGDNWILKVKENVLPYSIVIIPPLAKSYTVYQTIGCVERVAESNVEASIPIAHSSITASEGKDILPLRLVLYEENTSNLFAGKTVSSGTLVSHPFPVFGYEGKTIVFRANTSSSTNGWVIEILTRARNWRVYDAITYSANTDLVYNIAGNAVLARVKYTPATYPAVVNEGEVILC
jgi:hypothetical protein